MQALERFKQGNFVEAEYLFSVATSFLPHQCNATSKVMSQICQSHIHFRTPTNLSDSPVVSEG